MSKLMKYELPEELTVTAEGPVRVVTINRPDELNAVNLPLHWALANVWRQLSADSGAKVVILTGAGRAFSAGGDLDWITTFLDDPVARDESLREGAQIIEELLRFPLPVISAVNGPAVGLACSVAVLSDILLISDRAFLMDPHVSVGLVAGDGGAAFWPLLTPILRSREYLYTGDRIPAATAVELGLASRWCPPPTSSTPPASSPSAWRRSRSRHCAPPSGWPTCTWHRPWPARCRRASPPSGRPCCPPTTALASSHCAATASSGQQPEGDTR